MPFHHPMMFSFSLALYPPFFRVQLFDFQLAKRGIWNILSDQMNGRDLACFCFWLGVIKEPAPDSIIKQTSLSVKQTSSGDTMSMTARINNLFLKGDISRQPSNQA